MRSRPRSNTTATATDADSLMIGSSHHSHVQFDWRPTSFVGGRLPATVSLDQLCDKILVTNWSTTDHHNQRD